MNPRRTHPYSSISAIVFDVDNTLYVQTPEILQQASKAFCKAIRTHFSDRVQEMDDQYITMLGMRSLREYGDASMLFAALPEGDHCALHRKFHEQWPHDSVAPIPQLNEQMQALKESGIDLYAYSDAHQDWTHRVLAQTGLDKSIDKAHRLTRDQLACFSTKRDNANGYCCMLQQTGLDAHQMVMVDDSEACLTHAKKLGMVTVLITHGRTPTLKPPAHDYSYDSVTDFIRDFQKQRGCKKVAAVSRMNSGYNAGM